MIEAQSDSPSQGALEAVRRLAGPSAGLGAVARLEGGQHALTWRVDTYDPAFTAVVREFPVGDFAAASEQTALRALDGLDGLTPLLLDGDLEGRWSERAASVITWLDGLADITPAEPVGWARELARALATLHSIPGDQLSELPSIFEHPGASADALDGPLASAVRSRWATLTGSPEVLTHSDFWSGNVVWRDHKLVGVVDWSGAARGPRGFDLGWCRLDLVLLFDESLADVFSEAYEEAAAVTIGDIALWDSWATARSHGTVESWVPNYAPLGRADLDRQTLRDRHSSWTERLLSGGTG